MIYLNSDVELAGYLIPKDTHVLANIYAINMDEKLWENPEKFDPSRFIVDGMVKIPDHFFPFLVGKFSTTIENSIKY